jgi:formiminotetrahydrofolate cyclodeaminase
MLVTAALSLRAPPARLTAAPVVPDARSPSDPLLSWPSEAEEDLLGAGAAAGMMVSLAAELLRGVARTSAPSWPEAGGVAAQARAISRRADALARENATAHARAMEALHARGEAARERHDDELGSALYRAGELPGTIAEAARDLAELAALGSEHADPDRRADAAAVSLIAAGCARAAAHLVEINLGVLHEDPRLAGARTAVAGAEAAAERAVEAGR